EGAPAVGHRRAVQQHVIEIEHAAAALGFDALGHWRDIGMLEVGIRNARHGRSWMGKAASIPTAAWRRVPRIVPPSGWECEVVDTCAHAAQIIGPRGG